MNENIVFPSLLADEPTSEPTELLLNCLSGLNNLTYYIDPIGQTSMHSKQCNLADSESTQQTRLHRWVGCSLLQKRRISCNNQSHLESIFSYALNNGSDKCFGGRGLFLPLHQYKRTWCGLEITSLTRVLNPILDSTYTKQSVWLSMSQNASFRYWSSLTGRLWENTI